MSARGRRRTSSIHSFIVRVEDANDEAGEEGMGRKRAETVPLLVKDVDGVGMASGRVGAGRETPTVAVGVAGSSPR